MHFLFSDRLVIVKRVTYITSIDGEVNLPKVFMVIWLLRKKKWEMKITSYFHFSTWRIFFSDHTQTINNLNCVTGWEWACYLTIEDLDTAVVIVVVVRPFPTFIIFQLEFWQLGGACGNGQWMSNKEGPPVIRWGKGCNIISGKQWTGKILRQLGRYAYSFLSIHYFSKCFGQSLYFLKSSKRKLFKILFSSSSKVLILKGLIFF